jgi:hypothetical protein
MVSHYLDGLSMLGGMFPDLGARDDASLDVVEHDMSSALDQCAARVPGNGTGVRLTDTQRVLFRCHLLLFQHPPTRVADDALNQGEHLFGPLHQVVCQLLGLLTLFAQHLDS